MDTVLNQIIDQLLPNLEPDLRTKVKEKISLHLMLYLKKRVFENNSGDEKVFEDDLNKIEDSKQRAGEYGKRLAEKLQSLPTEKSEAILNDAMKELADVIYMVYNASGGTTNV